MGAYFGVQQWWRTLNPLPSSGIVTNGLVLNLDAGNPTSYPGSGTTWTDLSGNNYNGTLVNGVGYDSANSGSLVFDGSDDYCSVDPWNWSSTTSVGFFIYAYSNPSRWIFSRIFASTSFDYEVALGSSNEISYYTNTNSWNTTSVQLNSDAWSYVVISQSGTSFTMYVNGVSSYTGDLTTSPGGVLYLGSQGGNGEYLDFKLSAFHVYNRTLTQQEITQNFDALKGRYGL